MIWTNLQGARRHGFATWLGRVDVEEKTQRMKRCRIWMAELKMGCEDFACGLFYFGIFKLDLTKFIYRI